jgi:short-subunit dehydrogenase
MDFRDRVVFITGASNGIGKQLAIDLAARGAIVVGCGRSRERLIETLKEARKASPKSLMIACDIGDAEQVHGMMTKVRADFGAIDILINNAGIGMRQPFVDTPVETIEAIMRTNYLGAMYCTHEVLPAMIARGSGHIVNISSGAGKIGTLNMAAYCASKFAMNGWSESLYHELKPLGVNVSVICPGPVTTDFNREFRDREPKSPPALFVGAAKVSRQVIRAIEKNRFEVVMPHWLALMCALKGLAPSLFRAIAQRRFRPHVTTPARVTNSPRFPGNL